MQNTETLFKSIFNRQWQLDESNELMREIVEKYPYFTAAHFFNLFSKNDQSIEYQTQLAKTSILFNNNFWLNFQLIQENSIKNTTNTGEIMLDKQEDAAEENIQHPTTVSNDNLTEEPIININDQLAHIAADFKDGSKNTEPLDETALFEPLHTTDYFASQGIKLSEEVKPDDKLGNQLKSFTQWLKTMKKVHPGELEKAPIANESAIQQLAEKSNQNEQISTEAMVDVLIQQGLNQKALDMLEKLSLQNPSKSTYFASRIENLKNR